MHPKRLLRTLLAPSGLGVLLYLIITTVILTVSNIAPIYQKITPPDLVYYADISVHHYEAVTSYHLNNSLLAGRISLFVFWAAFGAAVYVVLWLAISIYVAIYNDIVIGFTYSGAKSSGHTKYFGEIVLRGLFRLCAALLLVLLLYVVMQTWYPLSVTMFRVWFENLWVPLNWTLLLGAYVGWFVVLHVTTILLRLSLLRTRVVSKP